MSLIASVYGRLGNDPIERTTRNGKSMASANVAIDVTPRDAEEQETLWVGLLVFGGAAGELLRAQKGQMVAALGRMTRGIYTPANGDPRESWTMLCDSVIVAKSAKPTGKPRTQGEPARSPAQAYGHARSRAPEPEPEPEPADLFDDEIPF